MDVSCSRQHLLQVYLQKRETSHQVHLQKKNEGRGFHLKQRKHLPKEA